MTLQEHVDEAIAFIRSTVLEQPAFVGFSGGKDSIVVEHLVRQSGIPYQAYYTATGIDPPQVVKFIRSNYPYVKWLRPRFNFWHLITTHNPPLPTARWCCKELKKRPSWKLPHRYRIMGIRAEESGKRAKYDRVNYFAKQEFTQLYPIFHWKEWMIWEYIEQNKLDYCDLYNQGFDRLGCVICPFHTSALHETYRKLWPTYYLTFEKTVHRWFNKRVGQGRTMHSQSPQEFLKAWYAGKASWYGR